MEMKIEKQFLNVAETAFYLGVSQDTIRNWVKRGEIPFYKFGRAVRFDLHDINKWTHKRRCDVSENSFGRIKSLSLA